VVVRAPGCPGTPLVPVTSAVTSLQPAAGPACGSPARSHNTDQKAITVRTYSPKPADIQREWHVIDATDVVLGRLAVQTATLLRGKHKPTYAPHVDTGDFVIIVNADKVALSGDKATTKMAYRHSGFPGGLSATPYGELLDKDPRKAVERAVWGMLPKNRLSRQLLRKLKVYSGPQHPHAAQKAQPFEITQLAQ
jgi:large subunit ribosomal protein L13